MSNVIPFSLSPPAMHSMLANWESDSIYIKLLGEADWASGRTLCRSPPSSLKATLGLVPAEETRMPALAVGGGRRR